jgi:hypothetical protein
MTTRGIPPDCRLTETLSRVTEQVTTALRFSAVGVRIFEKRHLSRRGFRSGVRATRFSVAANLEHNRLK